jgi:hypothetical protein
MCRIGAISIRARLGVKMTPRTPRLPRAIDPRAAGGWRTGPRIDHSAFYLGFADDLLAPGGGLLVLTVHLCNRE